MTDGNWPDPNRPGEPEDVTKAADYLLSNGPLDQPIAYSWIPAHGTGQAGWLRMDPAMTGRVQYSPQAAAEELYFRGPAR